MPEINHAPKPNPTKNATLHAGDHNQDDAADEDAPPSEGADKPKSSGQTSLSPLIKQKVNAVDSSSVSSSSKSSTSASSDRTAVGGVVRPSVSTTSPTAFRSQSHIKSPVSPMVAAHPPAPSRSKSHSIKRMFRMESSSGTNTKGATESPARSKGGSPSPTRSPLRNGTVEGNNPAPSSATMGAMASSSVSPSSTLPTPPSEPTSPPVSQPPSRQNSVKSKKAGRRLSFGAKFHELGNKDAVSSPVVPAAPGGAEGGNETPRGATAVGGGGEGRFTLKDILQTGPKAARKSSAAGAGALSSRRSDASSDRGGGGADVTSTGTSLLKKYGVCERVAIGKGATSVVRLAHKWDRSEEKLYAVKEFRKRRKNESEKEYVKKLTAEFCISSTLHHVNVVETVDLVQDEQAHWCEVMEYCPGGDLYAAIKKGSMSPAEIECSFKQILSGVQYLHSQGVAHRDLKPENLFFDTAGHLKIGDYGASTVYRLPWETTVHMSTGLCGSEPYIAPEQFLGKPYDARLVDIWAIGIVYYCLICQELPWRVAQSTEPLFASYQNACLQNPYKLSISGPVTAPSSTKSGASTPRTPSSRSSTSDNLGFPQTIQNIEPRESRPLLRRMLEPDPKLRVDIAQIMANDWIRSIEVCTASDKPRHQHTNIRAALGQTAIVLERDVQH